MTNKRYIKIEMRPTKDNIGGSFNAVADFNLDNIGTDFSNVSVKIDTGCSISTIPLARFKIKQTSYKKLKKQDIRNKVYSLRTFGVETGINKPPAPKDEKEMLECTALKFQHRINDFEINGVPINAEFIYINYDRTGNILIGMDILKDWDIHIGTVRTPNLKETGKTFFLACPLSQLNDEYYGELNRLFLTGDKIIRSPAVSLIESSDNTQIK